MTFLKSLRRTAAIAGTLTLGAGVVFAQGTPAPSGSADGSAVAAPADMAQKPDTAMAKQNNKTALSDEEVQKILDNAEATA